MTSTTHPTAPPNESGQLNEKDLPNKQVEQQTQQQKEDAARVNAQAGQSEKNLSQADSGK